MAVLTIIIIEVVVNNILVTFNAKFSVIGMYQKIKIFLNSEYLVRNRYIDVKYH